MSPADLPRSSTRGDCDCCGKSHPTGYCHRGQVPKRSTIISPRHLNYIEDRLIAPCVSASEARERLRTIGEDALADELMEAIQLFLDHCREITKSVTG